MVTKSPVRGWQRKLPRALALGFVVFVLGLASLMFVLSARRSAAPWINHDVAFHSWLGMEMLDGARLYVDFNDTNPPGSQFLHGALVATTDFLSAPDFVVHHLFVVLLGACGLMIIWSAFRGDERSLTGILVSFAYLVVVLRGNFSNNLFEGASHLPYDFGQREHLFALLFLPYLLWRLRHGQSSIRMVPWLLLLGFVSVFKPYWALFVVASELVLWAGSRKRDLPTWLPLAAGMVLPYGILLAHSVDSFFAFFTVVLPYHLGGGYAHYGTSYWEFAASPFHRQLMAGGLYFAAGWVACWQRRLVERRSLCLLALLVLGAYLSVLHQHKFWSYHGMVFFALVVVAGTFLVARSTEALSVAGRRFVSFAVLVAVIATLATTVGSLFSMLVGFPPLGHQVAPLVAGRERVMFFSMSVDYSYGALHHRVHTVGPWSVHSDLPAILAIEDVGERQRAIASYASQVTRRIEDAQPELLIFAPYRQALPPGNTLHGVIAEIGVIPRRDYRRWSQEELVEVHPHLDDWIVYERLTALPVLASPG